jgi:hypothetical protein
LLFFIVDYVLFLKKPLARTFPGHPAIRPIVIAFGKKYSPSQSHDAGAGQGQYSWNKAGMVGQDFFGRDRTLGTATVPS